MTPDYNPATVRQLFQLIHAKKAVARVKLKPDCDGHAPRTLFQHLRFDDWSRSDPVSNRNGKLAVDPSQIEIADHAVCEARRHESRQEPANFADGIKAFGQNDASIAYTLVC